MALTASELIFGVCSAVSSAMTAIPDKASNMMRRARRRCKAADRTEAGIAWVSSAYVYIYIYIYIETKVCLFICLLTRASSLLTRAMSSKI